MTEPCADPTEPPRESLRRCHRCIAGLLERLAQAPAGAEGTRDLAGEIDAALAVHLADEESDMFPALLEAAQTPARREQAFELVSSLLVAHRELLAQWQAAREALLAAQPGAREAAAGFAQAMRDHLEQEEAELAVVLGSLGEARSRAVARAIAHRHGASCPPAPGGSDPPRRP